MLRRDARRQVREYGISRRHKEDQETTLLTSSSNILSVAINSLQDPRRRLLQCPNDRVRTLIQIDRVALEIVQRDDGKRFFVCCREYNRRRDAGIEGLAPASGAQTPAIAGLQSGEADLRLWHGQIV